MKKAEGNHGYHVNAHIYDIFCETEMEKKKQQEN